LHIEQSDQYAISFLLILSVVRHGGIEGLLVPVVIGVPGLQFGSHARQAFSDCSAEVSA